MKRVAIYTAITGGYDSLKPVPAAWSKAADFIAYSDAQPEGDGWQIRRASAHEKNPCRNAKIHKIIPEEIFQSYEISIWIDGSVVIQSAESLETLLSAWLRDTDLAVFRHRKRACVYDEAAACILAGKDDPEVIARQMAKYRKEGYPAQAGLAECTVLVRRHTKPLMAFCRDWHAEIASFSQRDQLSFNPMAKACRLRYFELPGSITINDHFLWVHHDSNTGVLSPVRD